ncbi:MAG TPA: maleylpyruvate isomerase family mycothiol-dependent enzyme [Jatrophihabitantaceae bacterium]|nr:maleylpyruvate isomerase family mycothiol-dependent enzyme [Jatrophihabitantaceae bacterium]
MDFDAHIAHFAHDGAALAAAADAAGWDAPVPGTDWTVRDLVTHIGGVHRWAADIVRRAAPSGATAAGGAVGSGPGDAELLDWFRAGHRDLLGVLRSAPPDLDCFTFLPSPSARAFWGRRQAHETAVHRADAERADGQEPTFDTGFAQDGIDEVVNGFARRKNNAIERRAVMALHATDAGGDWTITLGGERIVADRTTAAGADVAIAGSSADLYQWLWNRPAHVEVSGDATIAELWRRIQVRWS